MVTVGLKQSADGVDSRRTRDSVSLVDEEEKKKNQKKKKRSVKERTQSLSTTAAARSSSSRQQKEESDEEEEITTSSAATVTATTTDKVKSTAAFAADGIDIKKKKNITPITLPEQTFAHYIHQHSITALQQESSSSQHQRRKFVLARYTCPHEAGNVFTGVLNSLLLAVLSNRTFVVEYSGDDSECHAILEPFPWVPRRHQVEELLVGKDDRIDIYEYNQRYQLTHNCRRLKERIDFSNATTTSQKDVDDTYCSQLLSANPSSNILHQLANRLVNYTAVAIQGAVSGCYIYTQEHSFTGRFDVRNPLCWNYVRELLLLDAQRMMKILDQRKANLMSYGLEFAYGMLFAQTFAFTKQLLESVPLQQYRDDSLFSIGMHLRYGLKQNKPFSLKTALRSQECQQRMREHSSFNSKCRVTVMADQQVVVEGLKIMATDHWKCQAMSIPRGKESNSNITTNALRQRRQLAAVTTLGQRREEHGPFAGAGFFQDLVLLSQQSQQQNMVLTGTRSSSALVLEAIVYQTLRHEGNRLVWCKLKSCQYCRTFESPPKLQKPTE